MLSNNKIKFIKSLSQKKYRFSEKLFVVEGFKNIYELLESDLEIKELYLTENGNDQVSSKLIDAGFEVFIESQKQIERCSQLKSNNFGIALVNLPVYEKINWGGISLVLDEIRDPGNLGTIIRTADWFGINQIVCSKETVDCFNPKVIQSTMGAFSRVKIVYKELKEVLTEAKQKSIPAFGAVMNGASIQSLSGKENVLIVIGSESHGISTDLLDLIDYKVTIPVHHISGRQQTESLNAAIATSILCYELRR